MTEKNKFIKSYLWGYNYKYPVAEVKGIPYSQLATSINVSSLQSITESGALRTALNNLRTALPKAMLSSFTYKPLVGISGQTSPSGLNSFFEYDPLGRLSIARDHNNNILKKYNYLLTGPTSVSNALSYTNVPLMGTFYQTFQDASVLPFNSVVSGGVVSDFNAHDANQVGYFIVELDEGFGLYDNPPPANGVSYVKINLISLFLTLFPMPADLHVDLIKDGVIVATRRFSDYNSEPRPLYVPAGKYQISLRQDENFNASTLVYLVSPSVGSLFNIKTGSTINLLPGVTYDITSSNVY